MQSTIPPLHTPLTPTYVKILLSQHAPYVAHIPSILQLRDLQAAQIVQHQREKGDTYCRFVCSFNGMLDLTAEKLNGPGFTVSVERADSAPVEPWRFPSELLLLRRVILLARSPTSAHGDSLR